MKAKFKIDLKKLETGEPVRIGKDLYAKKLTDSIKIYEIKPLEITPQDRESISEAMKTYDKFYEMIHDELLSINRLENSLYTKYCCNCINYDEDIGRRSECKCELADLLEHVMSEVADNFPYLKEKYEAELK